MADRVMLESDLGRAALFGDNGLMPSSLNDFRPAQARASMSKKAIVIYADRPRSGKTWWLYHEVKRLMLQAPNLNGMIVCDTFPNLKNAFGAYCDFNHRLEERLSNGSRIFLVAADSMKWMSMEADVVAIDMYKRIQDHDTLLKIMRRARTGKCKVLMTDFPEFWIEPDIIYG